jgi:rRNA maturation RNase YbeY
MRILISKDPRYPINNKKVRLSIRKILNKNKIDDDYELSVAFVGKRKARQYNEDYRKMDYIPEVLSFSQKGEKAGDKKLIGDLLICFPQARERAIEENRMVDEVLEELYEHGIKNLVNDLSE